MYKRPSRKAVVLALWLGLLATPAIAAEKVDHATIGDIRSEAFNRSQVGKLLVELTEDVGPRLSASPADHKAAEWARSKFRSWGLANVHSEAFDEAFARGWQFRASRVEWVDSQEKPLHALPKAWTPGTNGPVEGEVELVLVKTREDLEKYRGKLRGKILLLDDARKYKPGTEPDFKRHDEASLGELQTFPIPLDGGEEENQKRLAEYLKRQELVKALNPFFVEEGVLATLRISDWDNGVLRVTGGGARKAGENPGVPELVVAAEHYNQLVRTVKRKQPVKLRIDVDAGFTSEDNQPAYNTFAELPGGAKKDEVVIIGAHIDSWHTGTGANDNGAGVVVMMEALRILKQLGVTPRRTIRVALWSGEEQGLQGSSAYVKKHFVAFPEPTDPAQRDLPSAFRQSSGPLQRKAGYDKFAAYFNFDNGTGKIRGIYAQQNAAAAPIFEDWLEPFHDLGATTVTLRDTGSTDHISFDRVGLPGFQFVQDRADYSTNVHHTHLDTFDHASIEDLKQAAAIIASFAWQAANRDEKLPRKPVREK